MRFAAIPPAISPLMSCLRINLALGDVWHRRSHRVAHQGEPGLSYALSRPFSFVVIPRVHLKAYRSRMLQVFCSKSISGAASCARAQSHATTTISLRIVAGAPPRRVQKLGPIYYAV